MDFLLKNKLILGFVIGLLFALYIFLKGLWKQWRLKSENEKLLRHLQTKMELEAEANQLLKDKMNKLQEENENLRITVQSYRFKPSRNELELLQVYEKSLELMFERAPGFAAAWQLAKKEAQTEVEKTHQGILPFVRKAFGLIGDGSIEEKTEGPIDGDSKAR